MNREAIIVNQVHMPIAQPTIRPQDQIEALRKVLPRSVDAADIQPRLAEALQAEREWATADRAQVERLADQIGSDTQIVEVPAFDADVHDLAALARVASFLTEAA